MRDGDHLSGAPVARRLERPTPAWLQVIPSKLRILVHDNGVGFSPEGREEPTMASKLSNQLRGVADEFLLKVNRDRPEHLEAILAPSIVPAE